MKKIKQIQKDKLMLLYEKQAMLEKRLYGASVAMMSDDIINQIKIQIEQVKMDIYDEVQLQDFKVITRGVEDGEIWNTEEGNTGEKGDNYIV